MRKKERDKPRARSQAATRQPDTRNSERYSERQVKSPRQNMDVEKQVKL